MKQKVFLMLLAAPLLAGCFESDFDFKTVVNLDGTVLRETHVTNRGGSFFKVPQGPGWQSKSWETKGGGTLIPVTYQHILANGKFAIGQPISSDYEFDFARQAKEWGPQQFEKLSQAGIASPYDDHLFSHNTVRIHRSGGWLRQTYSYEETFQNEGILEVLLLDLNDEIRKQSGEPAGPLSEKEVEEQARHYLENEILPKIRFHAEVIMPGRIRSANTKQAKGAKAEWTFTMADFGKDSSVYELHAASQAYRFGMELWFFLLLFLGVGTLLWLYSRQPEGAGKAEKKRGRKKPQGEV